MSEKFGYIFIWRFFLFIDLILLMILFFLQYFGRSILWPSSSMERKECSKIKSKAKNNKKKETCRANNLRNDSEFSQIPKNNFHKTKMVWFFQITLRTIMALLKIVLSSPRFIITYTVTTTFKKSMHKNELSTVD